MIKVVHRLNSANPPQDCLILSIPVSRSHPSPDGNSKRKSSSGLFSFCKRAKAFAAKSENFCLKNFLK